MSDIERGIIAKAEKKIEEKKAEEEVADFSWWSYNDPNCYFCVPTSKKYKFEPGQ